jgi:hypothetical protein
MRKLTRKNLNKLAMTMNVTPENERDNYMKVMLHLNGKLKSR